MNKKTPTTFQCLKTQSKDSGLHLVHWIYILSAYESVSKSRSNNEEVFVTA